MEDFGRASHLRRSEPTPTPLRAETPFGETANATLARSAMRRQLYSVMNPSPNIVINGSVTSSVRFSAHGICGGE